ncbi:MAG TPA: hypothetical protein VGG10_13335 [Rhizomicrobium sp.]|jgi:hypothetical protein
MADDTLTTRALEKIAFHEAEALRLKTFVNEADKLNDQPPRFGDLSLSSALTNTATSVRSTVKRWMAGDFFNKPFSAAVRSVLVGRFEATNTPSPASVDEIHDALTQGSFDFGTSGADAQKNSIRISLGKNSAVFVRLPNTDLFGLVEWYGVKKPSKSRKVSTDVTATDVADEAANDTDEPSIDTEAS